MSPINEERIIREKLKELTGLVEQRDMIQAKITKTETAIRAFIELLEDEVDQKLYSAKLMAASKPLGLTESVKRIFRVALLVGAQPLSPTDVRDQLIENGFPISTYNNPLAVIYTTLNRLKEQKLIEEADQEKGTYKWAARESHLEAMQKALATPRQSTSNIDNLIEAISGLSDAKAVDKVMEPRTRDPKRWTRGEGHRASAMPPRTRGIGRFFKDEAPKERKRKSGPGDLIGDHADPAGDDPTIRQK